MMSRHGNPQTRLQPIASSRSAPGNGFRRIRRPGALLYIATISSRRRLCQPTRGAYHSSEIEYVFETLASKPYPWRPEDWKLSDMISSYWTNFAKTGNPNGEHLPHWPQYTVQDGDPVMHLKAGDVHASPADDQAQMEFLENHAPVRTNASQQ